MFLCQKFNPSHVLEALKQPQYWIIALFVVAQSITNAGVTNVRPTSSSLQ